MSTTWLASEKDTENMENVEGISDSYYNYDYIFDTNTGSIGGYTFWAGVTNKLAMNFTNGSGYTLTSAKIRIIFYSYRGSPVIFPSGSEDQDGNWSGPEVVIYVNNKVRYYDAHEGLYDIQTPLGSYVGPSYSASGENELVIELGTIAEGAVIPMAIFLSGLDAYEDIYFCSIMIEGTYSESHSITLSHTPPAAGQVKLIYNGQFNQSTGQLPALTAVGASFAYPQDAQGLFFVERYS